MMKKLYFLFFLFVPFASILAQPANRLTEEAPVTIDGIEYGFTIRRESKKGVGDKGSFSRYEVTIYATNKSGCPRIVWLNNANQNQSEVELARFDCVNATGYRLTAKSSTVKAQEFQVPVRMPVLDQKGNTVFELRRMVAGFALVNNETVRENFIVIVPLGEKPDFKVSVLNPVSGF
jgi:hypothetical protein